MEGPEDGLDAGESLVDCLLLAHMTGQVMTAKLLTTICHFASRAGVKKCEELALEPEKNNGGNAKKKIDRFMNKSKGDKLPCGFVTLMMPAMLTSTKERGEYPFQMLCPHAVVDALPTHQKTEIITNFVANKASLPPAFHQHPLVVKSGAEHMVPFSLFVDGLQFNRKSHSAIVFALAPVCGGPRLVLATLRKKLLCPCGCRGWCSLWLVFNTLKWSLECAANGCHPTHGFDGKPLVEHDFLKLAGKPLAWKFFVLQLKIDWGEVPTFGLPTWKHGVNPCVLCSSDQ
eukprot:6467700-Amphidinium_carterae.1